MAVCTPDKTGYAVNGVTYDRVTHVLDTVIAKEGLAKWRGRIGNDEADRITEAAAERGTRIHDVCAGLAERIGMGENPVPRLDGMAEDEAKCVVQFLTWARSRIREVYGVERFLHSDRLMVAGTTDLIVRLGKDCFTAVVDIKTGSRIRLEYALQLAAYEMMAREEGVVEGGVRRFVVRLDAKANEPEVREFNDPTDAQAWLEVVSIYRWLTKRRRV